MIGIWSTYENPGEGFEVPGGVEDRGRKEVATSKPSREPLDLGPGTAMIWRRLKIIPFAADPCYVLRQATDSRQEKEGQEEG